MPKASTEWHGRYESPLSAPAGSWVLAECNQIDAGVIRTAVYWLAAEAARTRLDAIIVVASLTQHAEALACALPEATVRDLVAGNIVRMNNESLQLAVAHEAMPQTRRHQVVLAIDLDAYELARVRRMSPAALFMVRIVGYARPNRAAIPNSGLATISP